MFANPSKPCVRSTTGENRRGVTLLEAILVIMVLSGAAIASSFVMDGQWVTNRTVKDLTIEVSQLLDAARNSAIANRSDVFVRRTRRSGIEQLEITESAGPYRDEQSRTVILGDEIRMQVRPSEIRFNADGAATRNATWSITQGRATGRVVVAPTSGRVTVQLP